MLRDEILREVPAKPLSAFPENVSGHAATTSAAATSEVPPPPSVAVVEEIAGRPESEEASGDAESADPPMKAVTEITTDARSSSGRRGASLSPDVERRDLRVRRVDVLRIFLENVAVENVETIEDPGVKKPQQARLADRLTCS
jgi:hypothetical protein